MNGCICICSGQHDYSHAVNVTVFFYVKVFYSVSRHSEKKTIQPIRLHSLLVTYAELWQNCAQNRLFWYATANTRGRVWNWLSLYLWIQCCWLLRTFILVWTGFKTMQRSTLMRRDHRNPHWRQTFMHCRGLLNSCVITNGFIHGGGIDLFLGCWWLWFCAHGVTDACFE